MRGGGREGMAGLRRVWHAASLLRSFASRARSRRGRRAPIHGVVNLSAVSRRNILMMGRRRMEQKFERIIHREAEYWQLMELKDILQAEPEQVVSLGPKGSLSRRVGEKKADILSRFARRCHALYDRRQDQEGRARLLRFTAQAQELLELEKEIEKAYEPAAVAKVRKLLMMCADRRLHVTKISQLRRDFGLPRDFHRRLVYDYPQYFRVLPQPDGPVLELTSWDPSLASTALESAAAYRHADMPRFKISPARGHVLTPKQRVSMESFQEIPFSSPYADPPLPRMSGLMLAKRRVILLHEILSMTNEKRTIVDYLTHFRKELMLPSSVMALLLKFRHIFYVSRAGVRLTVFLKEAYDDTELMDKNEWALLKDIYLQLIAGCKNHETLRSDSIVAGTGGCEEESRKETTAS